MMSTVVNDSDIVKRTIISVENLFRIAFEGILGSLYRFMVLI